MEIKNPSTNQIQLIHQLNSYKYKLHIPYKVERKIRFICQKIWNKEWSGVLFFTYNGSFETKDLVINCKDIFVMDIGTSNYTEFNMSPDVVSYMTEHPELLDCQMGLIHSHCTFSTFFSSTDTDTLKKEGIDRNNFVSLIVNNEGTYSAAITRKITKRQIKESSSYEFFGEGTRKETKNYEDSTQIIEWYNLEVQKNNDDSLFTDVDNRLNSIRKYKESLANTEKLIPHIDNSTLINNERIEEQSYYFNSINDSNIPNINNKILKRLIIQILTSSILVTENSKLNLDKWTLSMVNQYDKIFGNDSIGVQRFKDWADLFIEYLTFNIKDDYLKSLGYDSTSIQSIYSSAIIEELYKIPKNKYIDIFIETLIKYMDYE